MQLSEFTKTVAGKPVPPPKSVTDDLIAEKAFSNLTGWAVPTLRTWRARRKGPPAIVVGRKVWYRRSAYENWLLEHERGADSVRPSRRRKAK